MLTWDARVMAWNVTKTSNCSSGSSKNPESILIPTSLFVTEKHKEHPLSSYYRRERSSALRKIGTYVHTSAIWQETVKYVKITPPTWITPAKYSFKIRSKNFPLQTSYVKKWLGFGCGVSQKRIMEYIRGFFWVVFPQTLVNLFSETLSLNRKSLSLGKIH